MWGTYRDYWENIVWVGNSARCLDSPIPSPTTSYNFNNRCVHGSTHKSYSPYMQSSSGDFRVPNGKLPIKDAHQTPLFFPRKKRVCAVGMNTKRSNAQLFKVGKISTQQEEQDLRSHRLEPCFRSLKLLRQITHYSIFLSKASNSSQCLMRTCHE